MNNKKKYDIKAIKKELVNNIIYAYSELSRIHNKNLRFENELIKNAMFELLEKDTGSEEQFKKLLGLSYMIYGIAENPWMFDDESTQADFFQNMQPF